MKAVDVIVAAHVIFVILGVGPVAVAASMFPRAVRSASATRAGDRPVARMLHRITRVYGWVAIGVPALGLVAAVVEARFTELWLMVSIGLVAIAAIILVVGILPAQRDALRPDARAVVSKIAGRLAMLAGIFNVLWVATAVLMVLQPGASQQ